MILPSISSLNIRSSTNDKLKAKNYLKNLLLSSQSLEIESWFFSKNSNDKLENSIYYSHILISYKSASKISMNNSLFSKFKFYSVN